jgi:CRISPR-associated protein Cas2
VSDHPRRHLIAYDVTDDRRRTRIASYLSAHGDRVQYSVFVMDCRPAKLIRLRARLTELIKADEDSILLCDLGQRDRADVDTMHYLGTRGQSQARACQSSDTLQPGRHTDGQLVSDRHANPEANRKTRPPFAQRFSWSEQCDTDRTPASST